MSTSARTKDETPRHDAPLLGVARSLLGQRWYVRPADETLAAALAQRNGLPEVVGRLLAARGVGLDDAADFLAPSLRASLPDPSVIADMEAAAARTADAIENGEDIVIFGDYDVDGATSTALLSRFIRAAGGRVRHYIPDRQREGYGPNAAALEALKGEGADLLITVDCGIQAFEALDAARAAGLDVIVVDHHKAASELPAAVAIVNPNRLDDESDLGQLAAVGVAFMLVVAVNRELRARGHYRGERREPNLLSWLDLVALGTVCDVVPLTGLNRAFVHQGLKVMARRANIGLRALCDVAGLEEAPGTYHAGFLLGPRVNAGGRVGASDLGARLLALDDAAEAGRISGELDRLNRERREIEAAVLDAALARVADPGDAPVIVAAGEGWHPGVLGIVASRLKDRFQRPAFVVGLEGAAGKGSARSISGVDIGAAVIEARRRGLLTAGGGHPMAAGFSLGASEVDAFRDFLTDALGRFVTAARAVRGLGLDGLLAGRALTAELVEAQESAGPFGVGNPTPRYAVAGLQVIESRVVGADHVRVLFSHADGARVRGIYFRGAATPAGGVLLTPQGRRLHVAGKLKRDDWGAKPRVDLVIDDVAIADA